jgi:hypothetical protein
MIWGAILVSGPTDTLVFCEMYITHKINDIRTIAQNDSRIRRWIAMGSTADWPAVVMGGEMESGCAR